ncbi:hypothetical protein DF185_07750 [Marinifilum breve]|uniref:Uncharacterized protein n=1 Tax=Marinifilum breve TaxID=2184082 RepID=A0A2V3ZYM2_9BACT|nr:hypothetical protein DF185_07750 [Marinifilum breve]
MLLNLNVELSVGKVDVAESNDEPLDRNAEDISLNLEQILSKVELQADNCEPGKRKIKQFFPFIKM